MRTYANGKGVINILSAEKLYQMPKLYAASLLWMISELYEQLPEAGDSGEAKTGVFLRPSTSACLTMHRRYC
ncbi:helicase HerA-like domain-containing protein [Escherichia coli]